jgi:predicted transcriptional regulator
MDNKLDGTTDLHVALPNALVADLDRLARERGVRRVHVLREAVAEYVVRAEAERVAAEMRAYVADLADAGGEFVAETEAHTVERMLREVEW